MSSFPKIAAVVLAASAVIFMGVGAGMLFGRPNPVAEMNAPELRAYNFQQTDTGWSVTGPDGTAQTKENAFQAVLSAYKAEESAAKAQTAEMTATTETIQTQIEYRKASQAADMEALKNRRDYISQVVEKQIRDLMDSSDTMQALSEDTLAVRLETADRREDVSRLKSELEELRTDKYRLHDIQRVLTDRLLRLHLENEALQRRLDQLTSP